MSKTDFANIFKCLNNNSKHLNRSVENEIWQLYTEVNSAKTASPTVVSLSTECIQYFIYNLQHNPYPTTELIQRLLCLWNSKFSHTDNFFQDLYIDTLELLLKRLSAEPKDESTLLKFCSLLSQVKLTSSKMMELKEQIVPLLFRLLNNKILHRKYIFLSLLPQRNLEIIKYIVSLERDFILINSINWTDSSNIFLYFLHSKEHWISTMINNYNPNENHNLPTNFVHIINFLKLIRCMNQESQVDLQVAEKCLTKMTNSDTFINDCKIELHRQILLTKFCSEYNIQKIPNINSIFEVARTNSCLSTISRFVNVSRMDLWNKCVQLLQINLNFLNEFYNSHSNLTDKPTNWDIILFRGYCVMINLIQCIIKTSTELSCPEQYAIQITEVLNEARQGILNLENLEFQIEIIENVFALLFLRYEYFSEDEDQNTKKNLSGFVCNELVLRDVLNMLKYCTNEIISTVSLKSIDNAIQNRMHVIDTLITEGLRRLYFLTSNEFTSTVGVFTEIPKINYCRCEESSSSNIQQHYYSIELDSSDSEQDHCDKKMKSVQTSYESKTSEDLDNKYTIICLNNVPQSSDIITSSYEERTRSLHRRKIQTRKSETDKSSEGSETTASSGKSRKKHPKRSINSEAIRERRYLLNFMLSSPQSLICLCLAQRDYDRVHQVIKMYNMENTHIASNVKFTKNLQELRMQLRELFDEKSISTQASSEEHIEKSLIENIKKVTGLAYDTTQIINLIEQFFSINLLPENKETKTIIERYSSVYPFLNNYVFRNEIFMHVFDIALTLGVTYEQSLTLLKCACRYTHNFENNSEYLIFYENVKRAHQDVNTIYTTKSPNISIPVMLLNYKYPLHSKQMVKKLTFLQNLVDNGNEFKNLLQITSTHVSEKLSKCYSTIIQNINDYFKSLEIILPFNYLQRLQIYLNLLYKFSNITNVDIQTLGFKSIFDILNYKRSEIVDKFIYHSNIHPQQLEDVFEQANLNLIFHLVTNCFPRIECNNENYKNNENQIQIYETINVEQILNILQDKTVENENNVSEKIHPPNEKMLNYINQHNQLLAYLVTTMYSDHHDLKENIDFSLNRVCFIDNLINLKRNDVLKQLFENNIVVTALQDYINPNLLYNYIHKQLHTTNSKDNIMEEALILIHSLPERQLRKNDNLIHLNNAIAYSLANNAQVVNNYKYAEMIENENLKVNCILQNVKHWLGATCIRLLKECLTTTDSILDDNIKLILREKLNKIIIYENICQSSDEFHSWYEVSLKCEQETCQDEKMPHLYDPAKVLQYLIDKNMIETSLNFLKMHKVNEKIVYLLNAEYIIKILQTNVDLKEIANIFDQITMKQVESICTVLFKSLKNLKHLQFLIDYNIQRDQRYFDLLHNIRIGILILQNINPQENDNIWSLIDQPLLIIEQYLMNTRLEKLTHLIKIVNSYLPELGNDNMISITAVDNLLRCYAERALEFRIKVNNTISGSSTTTSGDNNSSNKAVENHLMQSIDSLSVTMSEKDLFVMPDEPPSKSEWMEDYITNVCLCCNETIFSMFNRRHHCRRCGRVVCGICSTKRMKVTNYGDLLVRVCNQCFCLTVQQQKNKNDFLPTIGERPESDIFVDCWQLTDNAAYNTTIRDEFSYEYAPSVSLCLSILKLHSRNEHYSKFLINQCNEMLRLILPSKGGEFNNEIDYNMVIQMLRSLLVAAKVSYAQDSYDSKSVQCDQLLGQIDILHMLASNDCLHLLPITSPSDKYKCNITPLSGIGLRKLRDNLLEAEKWNLALEVSTKAGLDTSSVFAVWGKSCLKAGCFQQAREKFQYCLDKVQDEFVEVLNTEDVPIVQGRLRHSESRLSNISVGSTTRPSKNPALLTEIVEILETSSCIIDPAVLKSVEIARNNPPVLKLTPNPTAINVNTGEPAMNILNKLANLKSLSMGHFNTLYPDGQTTVNRSKNLIRRNSKIQPPKAININKKYTEKYIYDECIYYLRTYGSHAGLIEFYLRHHNMKEALKYILDNKLDPDHYVDLYTYCLRNGCTDQLQQIFMEIDSTLDLWKDGLKHICRHLEQNGFLHILYQIQVWMSDNVRAAMTCIKFYQLNATNYTDLLRNLEYLHKAQEHLKQELESEHQWVQVEPVKKNCNSDKSLVLKMDSRDIDKHINTIWRQVEITKFLASNEKAGRKTIELLSEMSRFASENNPLNKIMTVPTLFGCKLEKILLAVLVIISGENITEGFGLAFRIIQDFQLDALKIFCTVTKYLAVNSKVSDIEKLVESIATSGISENITNQVCDEVLILAVKMLMENPACSVIQFKSLIKNIRDTNTKITAYIESKQLKTAYLLAIEKVTDRFEIRKILRRLLREAERLNQPHIRNFCTERLKKLDDTEK